MWEDLNVFKWGHNTLVNYAFCSLVVFWLAWCAENKSNISNILENNTTAIPDKERIDNDEINVYIDWEVVKLWEKKTINLFWKTKLSFDIDDNNTYLVQAYIKDENGEFVISGDVKLSQDWSEVEVFNWMGKIDASNFTFWNEYKIEAKINGDSTLEKGVQNIGELKVTNTPESAQKIVPHDVISFYVDVKEKSDEELYRIIENLEERQEYSLSRIKELEEKLLNLSKLSEEEKLALRDKIEKLLLEISKWQELNTKLQEAITNKDEELKLALEEKIELQKEVENKAEKILELEEQLSNSTTENWVLEEKIKSFQEELIKWQNLNKELQEAITYKDEELKLALEEKIELQKEVENKAEKILELEEQLSNSTTENWVLEEKIKSFQEELIKSQELNTELQEAITNKDTELQKTLKEKIELQKEVENKAEKILELEEAEINLNKELASEKEDNIEKAEEIVELKKEKLELQEIIVLNTETISAKNERIIELDLLLSSSEEDNTDLNNEKSELEADILSLNEKNTELKEQLKEFEQPELESDIGETTNDKAISVNVISNDAPNTKLLSIWSFTSWTATVSWDYIKFTPEVWYVWDVIIPYYAYDETTNVMNISSLKVTVNASNTAPTAEDFTVDANWDSSLWDIDLSDKIWDVNEWDTLSVEYIWSWIISWEDLVIDKVNTWIFLNKAKISIISGSGTAYIDYKVNDWKEDSLVYRITVTDLAE